MEAVAHSVDHFAALRARAHEGRALPRELQDELAARFGDRFSTKLAVREHHGTDISSYPVTWSTRQEERTRLWQARHDAYFACLQLRAGSRMIATEVCVPISRLAECIAATQEDIARSTMPIPLFGHVGDGNFHLMILVDPNSDTDLAEAWDLNTRLVRRALAMGGTCTGEHGIGLGKRDFLVEEFGEAVDVMRQIKIALDPRNLMNPGKIV